MAPASIEEVKQEVHKELALQNARHLMEKLNEHCFERCIPTPGPSMTGAETKCFNYCLEKYLNAWDTVSKQYVGKMHAQQQAAGLRS